MCREGTNKQYGFYTLLRWNRIDLEADFKATQLTKTRRCKDCNQACDWLQWLTVSRGITVGKLPKRKSSRDNTSETTITGAGGGSKTGISCDVTGIGKLEKAHHREMGQRYAVTHGMQLVLSL